MMNMKQRSERPPVVVSQGRTSCTDGTIVTAYPGDPAIDAHFDKPNAPIPHCPDGQTWHHTSGMPGFYTPSGELEVGQYALVGDTFNDDVRSSRPDGANDLM
jgi:hypothetical protein